MIIEDGMGDGYKVRINGEHQLHVYAASEELQEHTNDVEGEAYTMDIDNVTLSSSYYLLALKNTHDKDLIVTSVTLWVAEFKDGTIIEASIGGTFTYAAGGTVVVPANLNAGSGKAAEGSFYVNDGAATDISTITAGAIAGRYVFDTKPRKWAKGSGWVIPKNQCFFLKNDAANDNTWRGYLSFFYHDIL